MCDIYKNKSNVSKALEKVCGDLKTDAASFEFRLKNLMMITEQLIQEKLEAYAKEHPGTRVTDLVITIENDWVYKWEGGPMSLVRKVVITNPTEVE